MRKRIVTGVDKKRKDRFNQLLVGFVLIFLMILSVVGYGLVGLGGDTGDGSYGTAEFNGVEFSNVNGFWVAYINGAQFVISKNPNNISSITGTVNYISAYSGQPLYIYSEDNLASSEIYNNLHQFAERTQSACLSNETCEDSSPIKDCNSNFIIIRERNQSSIAQVQSCVYIEGPSEKLVELTDEFLLKTIGIKA